MNDIIIAVSISSGLIILALIIINILLICWFRKKKNESSKRLSTLSSDRRCRLVQSTPRRSRTWDNIKYVTTKPAKPKKKSKTTAETGYNKSDYEIVNNSRENVSDGGDEVFSTLHMCNGDSEPLSTDYDHIRLKMRSGDYDAVFFRNVKNDQEVDNLYARVDKNYLGKEETTCNVENTKSVSKNKTLLSEQEPDSNLDTLHFSTLTSRLSDSTSKSSIKVTRTPNDGSVDDVPVTTQTITMFDNRTNKSIGLVDENVNTHILPCEVTITSEYVPTAKSTNDSDKGTHPSHESDTVPHGKKSVDLQTDNSFLVTKTGKISPPGRQSAGIQVNDDDF